MDDETLRTKIFLESNRVEGHHSGVLRRAFIAELRGLSHEDLTKRFHELFPPTEEFPETPGYNPHENKEAFETASLPASKALRNHGPKSLASHPRGAFWTLLIQCSKCLLIESIDARRNGMPGGLQLEIGGKVLTETNMAKKIVKLPCKGCGGTFRIIGKMPNGYNKLYLPKPNIEPVSKPKGYDKLY